MVGNGGQWWAMVGNCVDLGEWMGNGEECWGIGKEWWEMVENGGEWWEMVKNCGEW